MKGLMMATRLIATPLLKQKRVELGYTQPEMAKILSLVFNDKISGSLYQKWEQQAKSVSMPQAVAISRELDAEIDELWTVQQ